MSASSVAFVLDQWFGLAESCGQHRNRPAEPLARTAALLLLGHGRRQASPAAATPVAVTTNP